MRHLNLLFCQNYPIINGRNLVHLNLIPTLYKNPPIPIVVINTVLLPYNLHSSIYTLNINKSPYHLLLH